MTAPDLDDFQAGRLRANARTYRPDPMLDRAADLFHDDRAAWQLLPAQVQDQSAIHMDLRDSYRTAVDAGLVPDDRPSQADQWQRW